MTQLIRPSSGFFKDKKVLRPIMTAEPIVLDLKNFKSREKLHGIFSSFEIPKSASTMAINFNLFLKNHYLILGEKMDFFKRRSSKAPLLYLRGNSSLIPFLAEMILALIKFLG